MTALTSQKGLRSVSTHLPIIIIYKLWASLSLSLTHWYDEILKSNIEMLEGIIIGKTKSIIFSGLLASYLAIN